MDAETTLANNLILLSKVAKDVRKTAVDVLPISTRDRCEIFRVLTEISEDIRITRSLFR